MRTTLTILWASVKYHARKVKAFFKEPDITKVDVQRELYYSAYKRWQNKRFERNQVNIGFDLFQEDTNVSPRYRRK